MKGYLKPGILLLIFTLFPSIIYSQGKIINNLDYIVSKFNEYCKAVPREEVFIHTDRVDYIAGEEMWFSVYVIDRQSSMPSSYSKIVYVELINRYNFPVLQKRIRVEKGSGTGLVILPDSLNSGVYTLRAYTNWMKNFLPVNCFIKDLNICNALSNSLFKTKPDLPGTTPERKRRRSDRFSEHEFRLETVSSGTGNLGITIYTTDEFRSWLGNTFYLIIETHGNINYTTTVRVSRDSTTVNIPGNNIPQGINHITLFESSGEPVFEKFIYTPAPALHNNYLTINTEDNWEKRAKVSIGIDIDKEILTANDMINLSLSVIPENQAEPSDNIYDYMIFGTEFGILPDNIKNKKPDEIPAEILNEFLLALKSSWIDWDIILSDDIPSFNYGFENKYHFLTGSLVSRSTLAGDPNKYVFLSTPSKKASFQYAVTDTTGKFIFCIPVTEEINDLVIQPEEEVLNNTIKIGASFSEVMIPSDGSVFTEKEIPGYFSDLSSNYQVRKIYGTSYIGSEAEKLNSITEEKQFYGKPDIELIMDDYIKLPVMQEVFFELIPGVNLKKKKSEYEITIYDFEENRVHNSPPGLFIDGVIIKDAAIVANMDPDQVEKIDMIEDTYYVGDYFFEGIINIITRTGNYSNVPLPAQALRFSYKVAEPVNYFQPPDYSTPGSEQSRIPDYRNTLYWNPSLKSNNEGKISVNFWASDLPGNYILDIQGLTARGEKISMKKTIRIIGNKYNEDKNVE